MSSLISNAATDPRADRRVSRTRRLLSDALFELLQHRPWEKITVQEIIDAADVGRSTFYAHYETKLDLLLAQLPLLQMPLTVRDDETLPDFLPLFQHVRDRAAAMRPVLAQPIRGEITDFMQDRLAEDWSPILAEHHPEFADQFTARFLAGATLATMRQYLSDTSTATPDEMAARLTALTANTLSG